MALAADPMDHRDYCVEPAARICGPRSSGPYALWNHEHRFISHDGGTTMRDRVTYALPFAWGGRLASWAVVKHDVEKIFDFRAEKVRRLFPG
jgi:ligand-binding SRPBCC domain-containing protein